MLNSFVFVCVTLPRYPCSPTVLTYTFGAYSRLFERTMHVGCESCSFLFGQVERKSKCGDGITRKKGIRLEGGFGVVEGGGVTR